MSHQSYEYNEKNGNFPLWTVSMFSGMPAFQIIFGGPKTPVSYLDKVFQLWLPEPANYFFLASICFYILCLCAGIRPWVSILGSLGFAFSTYNPSIITVGHVTKMLAIAYAPAVLGSVILLFRKKYLAGFVLTALFSFLHIAQNHQQITYYLLIIIAIMSVSNFIFAIREKAIGAFLKSLGLAMAAGLIGLFVNAVILFPVYDFVKYSKRGGQLIIEQENNTTSNEKTSNNKSVGLTKDYAFMWSYGKMESLGLLFPGVQGYGTHVAQRDGDQYVFPKLNEKSKTADYLINKYNQPEDKAAEYAFGKSLYLYWGDQPSIDAPFYLGAVICFLFVFSMFFLPNRYRWWILASCILGLMMSWGKNLSFFNYFLFDNLPLYNKFRAPSMTLVILQLLFPFAAALALEKLVNTKQEAQPYFRKSLIAIAVVFLIAVLLYLSTDYTNENKQWKNTFTQVFNPQDPSIGNKIDSINQLYQPARDNQVYLGMLQETGGDVTATNGIFSALKKDRAVLFGKSILLSFLFIGLTIGLIFLFLKNKINTRFFLIGLGLLIYIDLYSIDSKYLNSYNFVSSDTYEINAFPITKADQDILADKDPNFRVLNTTVGDPFQDSHTSWHHKSIGGYHPAKLGIYDDLIAYQLSGGAPNMNVLNMLNTKYFIQQDANRQPVALKNPQALGNCWFVKGVNWVPGPVEEMKALRSFNPKDTAIVEEIFKTVVGSFGAPDTTEYIRQIWFDNDSIKYESQTTSNRLAVFSEIFYEDWKAYIDGKNVPVIKANYVLRAVNIPPGKHTVEFRFEPSVYRLSYKISNIMGWALSIMLLLAAIYYLLPQIRRSKKETNVKQ